MMPRLKVFGRHHNRRGSSDPHAKDKDKESSKKEEVATPGNNEEKAKPMLTLGDFGGSLGSPSTFLDGPASPKGGQKGGSDYFSRNKASKENTPQATPQSTPQTNGKTLVQINGTPLAPAHSPPVTYLRNASTISLSTTHKEPTSHKFDLLRKPMSLLTRRRSSQHSSDPEPEPVHNPGIIYATRRPDWSGPKRTDTGITPVNGRSKSPLPPIVTGPTAPPSFEGPRARSQKTVEKEKIRTPVFKECFDEGEVKTPMKEGPVEEVYSMPAPTVPPPAPPVEEKLDVVKPPPLPVDDTPPTEGSTEERLPEGHGLRGVTLVDKGVRLKRHQISNASRFSFEVSSLANDSHEDLSETSTLQGEDGFTVIKKIEARGQARNSRQGAVKGRYPQRRLQKRWSESDFDDEELNGMYAETLEEDDMYFDDGVILETDAGYEEDIPCTGEDSIPYSGEEPIPYSGEEPIPYSDDPPKPPIVLNINTQQPQLPNINTQQHQLPTIPPPLQTNLSSLSTDSMIAHAPGNGSTSPGGPPIPFLNPIGGGLGYLPTAPYYTPNGTLHDPTSLQPLAITALQQQLLFYQQQQLLAAQKSQASSSGPSPFNEEDTPFNFDDTDDGMGDPLVEAANAEVLANDADSFYGAEFNFYASSTANSSAEYVAGGYFGAGTEATGFRPLFRQPSLTPISERSESSYRNSMVFPVGSPFASHPGSPIGAGYLSHGLGGGSIGGDGEELSLSQMLRQVNLQNAGGFGGMSPYRAMTPVFARPEDQAIEGEVGYGGEDYGEEEIPMAGETYNGVDGEDAYGMDEGGGYVDEDYGDEFDYGLDQDSSHADSARNSMEPSSLRNSIASSLPAPTVPPPAVPQQPRMSTYTTSPAPVFGFPEAQSATFHGDSDDDELDHYVPSENLADYDEGDPLDAHLLQEINNLSPSTSPPNPPIPTTTITPTSPSSSPPAKANRLSIADIVKPLHRIPTYDGSEYGDMTDDSAANSDEELPPIRQSVSHDPHPIRPLSLNSRSLSSTFPAGQKVSPIQISPAPDSGYAPSPISGGLSAYYTPHMLPAPLSIAKRHSLPVNTFRSVSGPIPSAFGNGDSPKSPTLGAGGGLQRSQRLSPLNPAFARRRSETAETAGRLEGEVDLERESLVYKGDGGAERVWVRERRV